MVRRNDSGGEADIEVKVAILGQAVKTVLLPVDSTVGDALEAAGHSANSTVKCNGEDVDSTDTVEDGDRLTVSSKVKGGLHR